MQWGFFIWAPFYEVNMIKPALELRERSQQLTLWLVCDLRIKNIVPNRDGFDRI